MVKDTEKRRKRDMNGEELDRALHECMGVIWKAYRDAVQSGNFQPFNNCFGELYNKYDDVTVQKFIQGMGMGLAPAATRHIRCGQ